MAQTSGGRAKSLPPDLEDLLRQRLLKPIAPSCVLLTPRCWEAVKKNPDVNPERPIGTLAGAPGCSGSMCGVPVFIAEPEVFVATRTVLVSQGYAVQCALMQDEADELESKGKDWYGRTGIETGELDVSGSSPVGGVVQDAGLVDGVSDLGDR